ncbi:protein Aster-B-like [Xyrichtys novacula]|uniref:Protein Aster-B-like n=1 Tax=Xyrichtys novacula TaxID=13765 RepID=A0AAV1FTR8_XYRNO|nr:protein Aster-B-like [Xyrichtys novacula]
MAASTATHLDRSTPACSPVLRKRSRSSTPQLSPEADSSMVEKSSSDQGSDRSPNTPEPPQTIQHQRTCSQSGHPPNISTRGGGKNSKKSQSWYNVLSPTYKQRNEDFRKLFKQLPDTERLIVEYSCALQRDILLQGRLYLSENWICFYSNIFRWETLLAVRLKDICSMTKEKTARLIPNAIQLCTDNEKHFFTSFGARDRTYMMMFRLWQNALLDKPLCPKELWHFVHQCYGNELGLTSDDEDYVPPDEDFNTMGFCEELPVEENNKHPSDAKDSEARSEISPTLPHSALPNNNVPQELPSTDCSVPYDLPHVEDVSSLLPDAELLTPPVPDNHSSRSSSRAPSPSPDLKLDLKDCKEPPREFSDSSETQDEGEVQPFHQDLNGRQYINRVYEFGVDQMYNLIFTESDFMRDFQEQRRFSDVVPQPWRKEQDGNQTREIMYTITLNNPLAPKTATVTETQTLYKDSQEKKCYVIDAEVIAHDVPYHDYFYTLNRYMLTRVAKNRCRLRVSTELRYRKQPWGLVRSFIERNSWSGLDEYFRHLEVELNKLDVVLVESCSHRIESQERGGSRRKRRQLVVHHLRATGSLEQALSSISRPEDEEENNIKHVAGSTQTRHTGDAPGGFALYNFSKLLVLVSLVLIMLVFLNIMLFYKLWMLEFTMQSLVTSQGLRPQDSRNPQTQLEWVQFLDSHQRYHDDDLQRWREMIQSSVLLLDKLRASLLHLHKSIGIRDYNSKPDRRRKQQS